MSSCNPLIHILAGENVCIHVITPIHLFSLFARNITSTISFEEFAVPAYITLIGSKPELFRPSTISLECPSTCFTASPPYNNCAPVINQTSNCSKALIMILSF